MRFSLLRLSLGQTADIAASRRPAGLAVDVAEGTLPPDFIGQAALDQIAAGHSPLWCAVFLIVRDADALVVGSCCFKDEPREGRVEVGYGIAPAFRRQGAASDALRARRRKQPPAGRILGASCHPAAGPGSGLP